MLLVNCERTRPKVKGSSGKLSVIVNSSAKKFLRQHPVQLKFMGKKRFFVGDFYCAEKKIIIEIDGKIHENQVEYDNLRDHLIKEMGIRVIRIKNEDLIDIPSLIEKLKPELL